MNIENEFADFIMQTNKDGSNKARSYLLALKSVNTLLGGGFLPEFDIGNIYDVTDIATLNRLGKHIHKEGRDPQASLIDPDAGEKAMLQPVTANYWPDERKTHLTFSLAQLTNSSSGQV